MLDSQRVARVSAAHVNLIDGLLELWRHRRDRKMERIEVLPQLLDRSAADDDGAMRNERARPAEEDGELCRREIVF